MGLLQVQLLLLGTFAQLSPADRPGLCSLGEGDSACFPSPWCSLEGVVLFQWRAIGSCSLTVWESLLRGWLSADCRGIAFILERQILVTSKSASLILGMLMLWAHTPSMSFARSPRRFFLQKIYLLWLRD